MKKGWLVLLCLMLVTLSGCTVWERTENFFSPNDETIKNKTIKIGQEDQVKIVPLYTQYNQYLEEAMKTGSADDGTKSYLKHVLGYMDEIGEQQDLDLTYMKSYFMLQATGYEEQLMSRTKELMKEDTEIKKIIEKSYTASHRALPKQMNTIFIVPINSEFMERTSIMGGVAGLATRDCFILFLSADYDKKMLAYAVAHEYHHTALYDRMKLDSSLGDEASPLIHSLLLEGKADQFAKRVVKGVTPAWVEPLEEETKQHVLRLMKNGELTKEDIMDGNQEKDIPIWSMYRLGKDIMDAYLARHPSETVADWTTRDAATILQDYKYKHDIQ
ncbi:DUF2268 domain-containing protein [Exiguobacterium sp. TDN 0502]|uniref:DUF2268 domain-containing protein n=1 Tax=Exiguobacterium sp. TDN 0502 TaxID=3420731 RepID=UPI003D77B64E